MFLVFFYFSGTSRSGEEFHLSSYIDRLEIFIVVFVATIFTLVVDLPIQNIKQLLTDCKISQESVDVGEASAPFEEEEELLEENNNFVEEQPVEEDFDSPFADREEDFVPVRPSYYRRDLEDSETESSRNYANDE
jgi:hypothetical protein